MYYHGKELDIDSLRNVIKSKNHKTLASIGITSIEHSFIDFMSDTEILLFLVNINGLYLGRIPRDMRCKSVCFSATSAYQSPAQYSNNFPFAALRHVPKELRDKELCTHAVKNYAHAFFYVPVKLRTTDLSLLAVKGFAGLIRQVPFENRSYKICLISVMSDQSLIEYVPFTFRSAIIKAASKTHENK